MELTLACTQALAGGAVCLQYRAKFKSAAQRFHEATSLKTLCDASKARFIVNDDLALAIRLDCGLHAGENDCGIKEARAALGADAYIGASCYDSLTRAKQAAEEGASYLAFGAFYPSTTKINTRRVSLDLLSQVRTFRLPVVAIGGITLQNAAAVIQAGADYIAVVNALFEDSQKVLQQAEAFSAFFKSTKHSGSRQ